MAFGKKTAILSAMGASSEMESSESMADPRKPKRGKKKIKLPNQNFKVKCHKRNC